MDPGHERTVEGVSFHHMLPRMEPEILEAKMRALLGALGAQELSVARRLLPPSEGQLHPPFEVLLSVHRMPGRVCQPPPPQAFDRLLGEACSFRLRDSAAGPLADWLRERGGGLLCGWALPLDTWPTVAVLARVDRGWDPGAVRRRVARRGMEALARDLCPPSWWLRSGPGPDPAAGGSGECGASTDGLRETQLRLEREILQQALRRARGNKSEAARALRLSRQGLYRKLRRHGLHPPGQEDGGEARQGRAPRL